MTAVCVWRSGVCWEQQVDCHRSVAVSLSAPVKKPSQLSLVIRHLSKWLHELRQASSPKHISFLFTVSERKQGQAFFFFFFSRQAESFLNSTLTPDWVEEMICPIMPCCLFLPALLSPCGSTCWSGVRRSTAGSSIMWIRNISLTRCWCSSQKQVGHSSLCGHVLPWRIWGPGCRETSASDDVCFRAAQEQTALCINKELWISSGEIYDCHIFCAGDIIIQARLITGEDEAFRTHLMLPLWKWIRLDCYILDSKVKKKKAPTCGFGWAEEELKLKLSEHNHPFPPEPCLLVGLFVSCCKILNDGFFPTGRFKAIVVCVFNLKLSTVQ